MPRMSSYSIEKKCAVVRWHRENGNNFHKTSQQFGIDRRRLREWCQKEQELLSNNYGQKKFSRKMTSGRPVLSEELDDSLLEFFERERADGLAVTNRMLSAQALKIAKQLGIKDFKASDRYIMGWKKRFNVTMRRGTNDSQKLPEDYSEAVSAFSTALKSYRKKNDYTPYNIGNMDQTMVRFDEPMSRTNNQKGESTIRITNTGCRKRGFTVALSARASGHKMPAFIILKEPSGRIPPKAFAALRIPDNVHVTSTASGWMTNEKFEEWVSRVWKGNEDDVRRLLILDQAPVHKSTAQESLDDKDTDILFIPAGCTSILQPADVVWMKPFKDHLRSQWANYIQARHRTANGNFKKPTRQDVIVFVSKAWDSVSSDLIEKSFKTCGISNALSGEEDGMLSSRLAKIESSVIAIDEVNALVKECGEVLFDSDSEDSFDGFSDSE